MEWHDVGISFGFFLLGVIVMAVAALSTPYDRRKRPRTKNIDQELNRLFGRED